MKKEVKHKKSRSQEVAMWIDRYEDLFSDFDPRPYSQKSLSIDFLIELKRASKEYLGNVALDILMPKNKRKPNAENDIKKRLKEYFSKHYARTKKRTTGILKKGLLLSFIGIVLMLIATFLLFYYQEKTLLFSFLIVLMEPGGWFLFWEGLNLVIFESRKERPDIEFYKKMANSKIQFSSY